VLDPFLGTGALLAEAGLLGARLYGVDRDPEMVRGALRNLAHLGVAAEELLVGDAAEVDFDDPHVRFDAVLTDAPYGRSSSTGGEPVNRLIQHVVPRWARRLTRGGRVVLIVPKGSPEIPGIGRLAGSPSLRVHRSLTREFRVYEPVT
jgi:tRNA (guanine10-N2)-dimethyltransferase